jgi:two-component system CheB/CheR fusion protein
MSEASSEAPSSEATEERAQGHVAPGLDTPAAPVPPPAVPVVGIGASAGGLDAFQRLLHGLSAQTGLAYVLVQHLDPTHASMLTELLGRATTIPVIEAEEGMRIDADHAYVIPPNRTMTVSDGHLRLVARRANRGPHLPVDAFFRSLAEVHGSEAVGVILSGAGSDGSKGIEAIKEVGGITIAQDSASARFASMPQSAVDTGAVDFVMTPEEIAEQLALLGSHLTQHPEIVPAIPDAPVIAHDDALRKILSLLQKRTGVDFQHYRRGTLHRRILRRMLVHRQETREGYLAHLRRDPAELDNLYEDLLIGVTHFFRDPDVFEALRTTAFPAMMQGHVGDGPVRVWVVGCAGGHETYSLAIALLEFLSESAVDVPIQIFGTDLSDASIAHARAACYPASIAEHVSRDRLRRFFTEEEGQFRIKKAVRDLCVFSRQNVLRDPPFSHLDLVSCRNVLIYLEPALQRRVFPTFHYALEPNGLLLLGNAESVAQGSEYFEPIVKSQRIYRRRQMARRDLDLDVTTAGRTGRSGLARVNSPVRPAPAALSADEIEGEADRAVATRLSPHGVVVNEHMEILQFRGDTAGFLAHAPGKATLGLANLARSELVAPLRTAIRRARSTGLVAREEGIVLIDGGATRQVAIEVLPFQPPAASAPYFVVLFTEQPRAPAPGTVQDGANAGDTARPKSGRVDANAFHALQNELFATKQYLDDIIGRHEATNDELRAASEEVQSSNEELQSTNEELETTKEEIQSTNEELTTLNEELRHRNRDLGSMASDLSNVLVSTTIPIVIVGADLRLRRFTPASARVMRVIASDVGRPLGDVKLRIALPDLERQIASVVETLSVVEQEIRDDDGRWWALRIQPYKTIDNRVDGAVLVFADIDASKRYGERADEVSEVRRQLLEVAETGRVTAEVAQHVAEAANRTKAIFLASMSHDLRTPLNAISGYAGLLEQGLRGPLTEVQLADMGRIQRSARYLLALINDILNFAKAEAGHVDLQMTNVLLAPVVAELHDLIAPQLLTQSFHFERSANEVSVYTDSEKLRQILLNLLSNSIKFTAPDGDIGIDTAATGDVVRIEVWDSGRGIPPEQLEHIFEPFVQVDRGLTSPPPGGVGLGLSISRDLARAMGGDLKVESTVGQGSRFILTLPPVR